MTTVRLFTDPGVLVAAGGQWLLIVETRDANGYLTSSVAPALLVTLPNGTTAAPIFTPWSATSVGYWEVAYTTTLTGRYLAHISTPEDAIDAAAYAVGPSANAALPTVDDVARYLKGAAASWSMAELQEELDSETEHQQSKCGVRAAYPAPLRKALLRRVQRALAMRALPLATMQGDADGGSFLLPGNDPEVRRLEAPYRKLPTG